MEESTYVPFKDGLLITPPYNIRDGVIIYKPFDDVKFDDRGGLKCEYCGKPTEHANCHAHKDWCPLSCDHNKSNLPAGGGFTELSILLIIYTLFKIIKK